MPAPPPDRDEPPTTVPMLVWAYGTDPESAGRSFDLTQWRHDGPKFVWLRDVTPLVEGVPMTPFTRAAMAGDVASSLTHFGTDGLHYINADYTLTLSRLPEGPDIGLAALTHSSHDGVAHRHRRTVRPARADRHRRPPAHWPIRDSRPAPRASDRQSRRRRSAWAAAASALRSGTERSSPPPASPACRACGGPSCAAGSAPPGRRCGCSSSGRRTASCRRCRGRCSAPTR